MTDEAKALVERRYLLVKRGLYYAPDSQGYTEVKARAGRYREVDVLGLDGVTAVHEDEAPDFAPACWEKTKLAHLNGIIETQAREIERLRERWAMIDQLRGAEGCSVEIIHDNPDPGASNCAIYVTDNFGEDYSTYYGDTVDDCLRHAVEARAALAGDSHEQ